MCVVRDKGGKTGPSYLLNKNGDLPFIFYFSKQCFVGNIQGKFQKNCSLTFISEVLQLFFSKSSRSFSSRKL